MCGIIGVIGTKHDAANIVFNGLKTLEYRGYDSWGVAADINGKLAIDKHTGKIGEAQLNLAESAIAIGHTRWATHGGVTTENTHPHLDCSGRLAVVHNGIVENHAELKGILSEKDHQFVSETDTEIIAHLIEEELKKTSEIHRAVFAAFGILDGSNAITVLDIDSQTITAARNGSPLSVGISTDQYFVASDVTPFLDKTNQAFFIEDGEGVVLKTNEVILYDLKTGKVKKPVVQTIDWKVEDAQKQGYDHFLLKEIMEQKKTIKKTAGENERTIIDLAKKISAGHNVVLIGCGTAYFCCLAGQYYFVKSGVEAHTFGAYEFAPFANFCNDKTVVIAVSQSGETADTLIAARLAKAKGSHVVAVVNARGSTLERLADSVLPVAAGPEIAVVSTKAFMSQLITLYLLSKATSGNYQTGRKHIDDLSNKLDSWLSENLQKQVINLVKQILDGNDIYLIGKYENYPAALESALKIKETSYIHSEAFASGELKHGVITLIQKGTPCIVLASNDRVKQEILSSAAELKARGGYIVGIAPFKATEFDYHIQTPDAGELTIIPNIIVGQLLGYYLGIGRGTDPDKPRNLAKSVTVK